MTIAHVYNEHKAFILKIKSYKTVHKVTTNNKKENA